MKLASIQISVSERTAIRLWPATTLLPGIDVAPRDDAVDLGHHVAVAEIQLGLIEVALRLQQLRPRPA